MNTQSRGILLLAFLAPSSIWALPLCEEQRLMIDHFVQFVVEDLGKRYDSGEFVLLKDGGSGTILEMDKATGFKWLKESMCQMALGVHQRRSECMGQTYLCDDMLPYDRGGDCGIRQATLESVVAKYEEWISDQFAVGNIVAIKNSLTSKDYEQKLGCAGRGIAINAYALCGSYLPGISTCRGDFESHLLFGLTEGLFVSGLVLPLFAAGLFLAGGAFRPPTAAPGGA